MSWFQKITQAPNCTVCQKKIRDDFCIVMEKTEAFETCMCLDCRDRLQKKLEIFNPYIAECLMNAVDEGEQITPTQEYDVIQSSFAACL